MGDGIRCVLASVRQPDDGFFYMLGEQAFDIYAISRMVRQGDIVLDCGANYGAYSRKVLERGAAKVVAIEPDPVCVIALRKTFAKEIAEGRVVVYPKGVWHEDDELAMQTSPAERWGNTFVLLNSAKDKGL